jgi:protocatechuate 3,4-dioxygenase beta subunit
VSRRARLAVGLAAAVAAVLVLALLSDPAGSGSADDLARPAPTADGGAPARAEDDPLVASLRERALLRGLPAVDLATGGSGRLVGAVMLHVAGAEPRPLPGVEVEAVAVDGATTRTARAETDARGAFAFDPVAAHGGWAVVVRHPPYREVVLRGVAVAPDRASDVGTILLGAPTSLAGEVLDAAGRPVPGATVQVLRDAPRREALDFQQALFDLQAAIDPLAATDADRDGRFRVEGVSPGRYVLRVSAPGHATAFREDVLVTADERSADVRVVLDPGAGWTGRVVDEEGRGVPGARVLAIPTPSGRISRLDRVETRSGPDGHFRLDTLVSGLLHFVEAWAEGHAPSGRFLAPRGVGSIDLVLVRAGRIEGTIRDEATGEGVAGAEVIAGAGLTNSLSPVATTTDAAGRYVLATVSPGPVFLFVARARGYQRRTLDLRAGGPRRVVAGETLVVDLALPRGVTLSGRVLAEDGSPLPHATVGLLDVRDRWDGERTAVADASGRYAIESLRPATYEARVAAPGFAPIADEKDARFEIPAGALEHARDFVLQRGAEAHGRVLAPDGAAVAGAAVRLTAPVPAVDARLRDLAAVSDAGGRWRLRAVPAGAEVQVVAGRDGYASRTTEPLRFAAGERREIDLVLREGARLPGRVADARGRAVEGARVRWGRVGPGDERRLGDAFRADELLGTRVLRTDADGRFEIDRLEAGRHVVKVEREGFCDWYRKDVAVPEEGDATPLTATLEGSLPIRGRVLDATTGAPVPGCWVYAKEEDPSEGEATDPGRVRPLSSGQTAPDGTYSLDRLPPGRFEVVAWLAIGYRAAAQDGRNPDYRRREVRAGSSAIDFRLPPDR